MSDTLPAPGPRPDEDRPAGSAVTVDDLPAEGLAGLTDLDAAAWRSLESLSRALRMEEGDVDATLHSILVSAVDLIDGTDAAGLNLFVKGRFVPQVVHGSAPPLLDAWQEEAGVGPCIDASRDQVTIEVRDMTTEARWRGFPQRAVELGVLSMLCVPLWVDERKLGSLSLYAGESEAFSTAARHVANLYATHAALALSDVQRTSQLRRVIANRDVIGQAKGVLMATRHITPDDAFGLLTTASQTLNRKLVEVAQIVASTGELPAR